MSGEMPWWSIIYLVLFLVLVLSGTWLEVRDREERIMVLILDSASFLVCGYLFVGFWVSALRQTLGVAAPILFVLAAGWEIYDAPRGMRCCLADPDMSKREKRWALVGITAFMLPAYIVAGLAAFR